MKPLQYYETMISVSDDWYPNYPGNQVRCTCALYGYPRTRKRTRNQQAGYYSRIYVSGADDTYVVRCSDIMTLEEASEAYASDLQFVKELEQLQPIDREYLESCGFRYE